MLQNAGPFNFDVPSSRKKQQRIMASVDAIIHRISTVEVLVLHEGWSAEPTPALVGPSSRGNLEMYEYKPLFDHLGTPAHPG